ncbi:MAG: hypothetical protein M9950_04070 [Thermomicrobiales bacterium]|nr:hypothetical protein [Thermomicrobiales bacterium]MCO5217224.1 hypothetical protein [Thermomicrobiales bacterium]
MIAVITLASLALVPPAGSAQGIDPVGVLLQCNPSGSAYLTVSNRTVNTKMFAILTSLAPAGNRVEASFPIEPLLNWEATAQRNAAPTNGYRIAVYDYADGTILYDQTRTSGNCTSTDENTLIWDDDTHLTLTPTPSWWNGGGPTPSPTPVPNSFRVTAATRTCDVQTFVVAWNSANVADIQVSLTNTSDGWTSGWITLDPSMGYASFPVAHHNYDKAAFSVRFHDGMEDSTYNNLSGCATDPVVPAPSPTSDIGPSVPSQPNPPSNNGSSAQAVTSLPSTGSGTPTGTLLSLIAMTLLSVISFAFAHARRNAN